jgi:hypothetical protein
MCPAPPGPLSFTLVRACIRVCVRARACACVPDAQADSDASPKVLLQVNACLKPDVCGYLRVFVVYAAMFPGNVHEMLTCVCL